MNDNFIKIIKFIDIEDEKNVSLFVQIVKNYYYNHDLPTIKDQTKIKKWFQLSNLNEIELFLSNISDDQYDRMIEMINMNTNTNKDVGAVPYHKKCNLPIFMGSLDKIKNQDEYNNWKKKMNSCEILVTEKLDGISALLSIDKKEVKLCTRGNGKIGCDISHLIKYINLQDAIDNTLNTYKQSQYPVHIRGELIVEKENKPDVSNLRNVVSGLVHTKEITQEVRNKLKDVHFVAYRLYNEKYYKTQLQTLTIMRYRVPQCTIYLNKPTFEELTNELILFINKSKYQIDGIVVSFNHFHIEEEPVDKNPEHSIAIKNISETKKTEVIEVEWNVSKHGVYKPRVKIQPININGANIEWVTGFNAKYINDNNIGRGAILEVERSGDVIPNIKNVLKGTKTELPNGNWSWNKTGVDIIIQDEQNNEMEIKKLLTFFEELECPYLGPKTIETLYEHGYVTVSDMLNITKDDLLKTDKFKDKSADNILKGINKAKEYLSDINNDNLHHLMYASGSFGFGFGSKKIKMILEDYPNIVDEYKKENRELWINNIKTVKGIMEQAEAFVDNINKYNNFIKTIQNYVTIKKVNNNVKENKENKQLRGVVVLSGFRDKLLKKTLEDNGYTVNDNVTKETTIVIYSEDDTSSKCQKAKKMGIMLISKHEALTKLNIIG
uniref:DNA ligase (NAD(+)) n=1 Tax=viral metagenome TaxID=1070528 RepID=A0A6C0I4U7_9ZZZZ